MKQQHYLQHFGIISSFRHVDETIKIIINHVYNHRTLPTLKIPPNISEELLNLCTKELPFISADGWIYKQVDGVAMGSPLGSCFTNFYMGNLEYKTFENSQNETLYIWEIC